MADASPLTRRDMLLATAGCFTVSLALYVLTAARTVQGGDSGELALIGVLGGVAHPPGYPLYSILVRIGARLPLGPLLFRVALVSAICGAASVAVLQRVCFRVTRSLAGSCGAALAYGLSPIAWKLAGIPEVFTLHALLAAGLLLFSLRLAEAPAERLGREAFALGLVGGLGLSNQLTIVWCAPVLLWAVARRGPRRRVAAGALLGGALLGLLPYATLPYFARHAGPGALAWGNPVTLHAFLDHVLRRQYGTFQLASGAGAGRFHAAPLFALLEDLPRDLLWVPLVFAVAGLVIGLRRWGSFAVAVLIAFLLSGPLFASLFNLPLPRVIAISIEERFHLLPLLLLTPFVALGLAWALDRAGRGIQVGALVVLAAALITTNRTRADWSHDTVVARYAWAAVHGVAPDAVVVGTSDTWFSAVRWVTQALRRRPDVHYVDIAMVRERWYADRVAEQIPRFPRRAVGGAPWQLTAMLAGTGHPTYVLVWDDLPKGRLTVDPEGLVDRVVKPGTAPRTPVKEAADLLEATGALGRFERRPFEALDVSSQLAWKMAGQRWLDMGARLAAAGDAAQAKACRAEAFRLFPPGAG